LDEPETVYTRETANLLLDEVQERLVRLQRAYADVAGHRSSMASSAGGNGGDAGASRWLDSSRTAADELSWFRDRGIVVRDIEQGADRLPRPPWRKADLPVLATGRGCGQLLARQGDGVRRKAAAGVDAGKLLLPVF
jgi:hypothetical protein